MLIIKEIGRRWLRPVLIVVVAMVVFPPVAGASTENTLLFTARFGREVDLTQVEAHAGPTLEDVCTVESGDTCKYGNESSSTGGFTNPEGVAVGPEPTDYVYVADKVNGRVQIFTPDGVFVSMFGWEVNETKSSEGAPQEQRDVCTAASDDVCRAGQSAEPEGPAGRVAKPVGITIDQSTGNVYVWDKTLHRVEEYTAEGAFVLTIGREVNETEVKDAGSEEQKNVCTEQEIKTSGVICKAGEESALASTERDAFKPVEAEHGNIIAFGGGMLYVGDEERIQEIEPDGKWVRNISLAEAKSGAVAAGGTVKALAVDPSGNIYLVYNNSSGEGGGGIRELDSSGTLVKEIDPTGHVYTFALDPPGHIAAIEREPTTRGVLLEASSGKRLGIFSLPVANDATDGVAFSPIGYLYGVDTNNQDIEKYIPSSVAFVSTGPDTGLTATTATLTGEINSNEVAGTSAWFQYGTTEALESQTSTQSFVALNQSFPVQALVTLVPNQLYYYRIASEDANSLAPAPPATGETLSFTTPVIAPQIPGEPSASFVRAQSAVLNASVNPEHTATRYHFEYGACPVLVGCATVLSTPEEVSSVYGTTGSTQEIVGLAPSTTYSFRLVANNEFEEAGKIHGGESASTEGRFTTGAAPAPSAATGSVGAVTTTSAVISGMINPDGLPASYTFEVGVYEGAGTQYGVVFSGLAGSGSVPVEETLPLTGLQPGTTYVYRITISSGYIGTETHTLQGQPVTFTTAGLPTALVLPPVFELLPIPNVAFPKAANSTKKKTTKKKTKKKAKASPKRGKKAKSKKGKKGKKGSPKR